MAARCHHGCDEQIFGADEQDPGRGQSDQGVFDPTRCRAERGRILVSAPLRQPTPAVNGWGLSRLPRALSYAPIHWWYLRRRDRGQNHATDHQWRAAARHLDMLDGERNLASKQLRRL